MYSLDGQRGVIWLHNTSDASRSVLHFCVGGGYFSNIFETFF